MGFRTRLIMVSALAVAAAIAIASAAVYLIVTRQTLEAVDVRLRSQLAEASEGASTAAALTGALSELESGDEVRVLSSDGEVLLDSGARAPVGEGGKAVASGLREESLETVGSRESRVRVFTAALPDGGAVQIHHPLAEAEGILGRLAFDLVLVSLGGVGLAAVLGWLVARRALSPVLRLTRTAEEIALSRDLSRRLEAAGSDEISRLASSFNVMLGALDRSIRAQRQLVADASHALRTPLTSLRTNFEVLAAGGLDSDERSRLIGEVATEFEGLGRLVEDLVHLALDDEPEHEMREIALDDLVAGCVERAARQPGTPSFRQDLAPCRLRGVPHRIERAVDNLVDNAARWSPPGAEVEVRLRPGELTVRDHGPGIDPADLPYVFDRFYRARSARGTPGFGLGLAIVKQVVESHGWHIVAEAAPGGGTRMRVLLPQMRPPTTTQARGSGEERS